MERGGEEQVRRLRRAGGCAFARGGFEGGSSAARKGPKRLGAGAAGEGRGAQGGMVEVCRAAAAGQRGDGEKRSAKIQSLVAVEFDLRVKNWDECEGGGEGRKIRKCGGRAGRYEGGGEDRETAVQTSSSWAQSRCMREAIVQGRGAHARDSGSVVGSGFDLLCFCSRPASSFNALQFQKNTRLAADWCGTSLF